MRRQHGADPLGRRFDLPAVARFHGGVAPRRPAANEARDHSFREIILSIPPGRVSSYGRVAAAAGYPRYHRAVARLLRHDPPHDLPWHRVVGADGRIKLVGDSALEQRNRLQREGVSVHSGRVEMEHFEHILKPWEIDR